MTETSQTSSSPTDASPARKKRRIFRWIFLAIQALFLVWIITGGHAAASSHCDPNLSAQACTAARQVGGGIGVLLIVFLWLAVDVILGVGYLIFRKK